MAEQTLAQQIAAATAKIKQAALDAARDAVSNAKDMAIDFALSTVKNTVESLKEKFYINDALDLIDKAEKTVETASATYDTAVKAAEAAKAAALSPKQKLQELAKQAAEAYKNSTLKSYGINFDVGLTNKKQVFSTIDPTIEPDKSTVGLFVMFNGAKVKLNSIDELNNVISEINKKLKGSNIAETRAQVHKFSKVHPLVDVKTKKLEFFKPVSNETGSTYLAHTPDTPNLALEDWRTSLPQPVRTNLRYKISDGYSTANDIYQKLNLRMTMNISSEFYYTRGIIPDFTDWTANHNLNALGKTVLNNDFHIAGDYTFAEDHLSVLYTPLMTALLAQVGGAGKLINWLTDVNNSSSAMSGGFKVSVEGKDVVVDLKGNKIGVIATIIDTRPIKPKGCK